MSEQEDRASAGIHSPVGAGHTRRTIVKGAVWSVPVIAAATVAPLSAASTLQTYTATVSGNGTSSRSCSFILPAGAKDVTYSVAGGAGGGLGGGNGALLTGTLSSPTVATPITIVAAGGGIWGGSNKGPSVPPRVGLGGQGFGNGGTSPLPTGSLTGSPANTVVCGAGGGGGSALLIGGVAAVVAGGGGGVGEYDGQYNNAATGDGNGALINAGALAGSGAMTVIGAAPNGQDSTTTVQYAGTGPVLRSITGRGGVGGSSAAGGAGGSWTFTGTGFTTGPVGVTGGSGTLGTVTAGGDGGAGVMSIISGSTWSAMGRIAVTSGGGGGGFSGGGAGGGAYSDRTNYEIINVAAPGGGGSNYVGNTGGVIVTNTAVASAGNRASASSSDYSGGPGKVTITFSAPPGLTIGC